MRFGILKRLKLALAAAIIVVGFGAYVWHAGFTIFESVFDSIEDPLIGEILAGTVAAAAVAFLIRRDGGSIVRLLALLFQISLKDRLALISISAAIAALVTLSPIIPWTWPQQTAPAPSKGPVQTQETPSRPQLQPSRGPEMPQQPIPPSMATEHLRIPEEKGFPTQARTKTPSKKVTPVTTAPNKDDISSFAPAVMAVCAATLPFVVLIGPDEIDNCFRRAIKQSGY